MSLELGKRKDLSRRFHQKDEFDLTEDELARLPLSYATLSRLSATAYSTSNLNKRLKREAVFIRHNRDDDRRREALETRSLRELHLLAVSDLQNHLLDDEPEPQLLCDHEWHTPDAENNAETPPAYAEILRAAFGRPVAARKEFSMEKWLAAALPPVAASAAAPVLKPSSRFLRQIFANDDVLSSVIASSTRGPALAAPAPFVS